MTNSNTKLNTDDSVFDAEGVKVYYNGFLALVDVHIKIPRQKIVAFIGPSGCGKSTLLRCFNRMNDLIPGAKVEDRWEWCFKDRIRFPRAFMKILPMPPEPTDIKEIWMN